MRTSKVIPIGLVKSSGNGKRRIDAGRNCVMIAGPPANRDKILAESTEREQGYCPGESVEISAY